MKCSVCNKDFETGSELKKHVRLHTGECPYECQVCGERFAVASNRTRHERTHTKTRKRCPVCKRLFVSEAKFEKHVAAHKEEASAASVCTICNRSFSRARDLKRHMAGTHGQQRYTCAGCGRPFGYSFNRDRHQRRCEAYKKLQQERAAAQQDGAEGAIQLDTAWANSNSNADEEDDDSIGDHDEEKEEEEEEE